MAPDPTALRRSDLAIRPKTFTLQRDADANGMVGGTGRVAEGVVFSTGWVALQWLGITKGLTLYPDIGSVHAAHGYDGKTRVVFDAP